MPYATEDRFGRIKVNPRPKKEGFLLGADAVIYAHTLCGVHGATGELVNLNGNEAAVSVILYADEHLERGHFNDRVLEGAPYDVTAEALSDMVVYLNAVDLVAGDEGRDVFLVNDNTVSTDDATGTRPYVGTIEKVVGADYAAIYVPGLYRA